MGKLARLCASFIDPWSSLPFVRIVGKLAKLMGKFARLYASINNTVAQRTTLGWIVTCASSVPGISGIRNVHFTTIRQEDYLLPQTMRKFVRPLRKFAGLFARLLDSWACLPDKFIGMWTLLGILH